MCSCFLCPELLEELLLWENMCAYNSPHVPCSTAAELNIGWKTNSWGFFKSEYETVEGLWRYELLFNKSYVRTICICRRGEAQDRIHRKSRSALNLSFSNINSRCEAFTTVLCAGQDSSSQLPPFIEESGDTHLWLKWRQSHLPRIAWKQAHRTIVARANSQSKRINQ